VHLKSGLHEPEAVPPEVQSCEAGNCGHPRCRDPRGAKVAFRVLQVGESEDSLGASSSSAAPLTHRGLGLADIHSPTTPYDVTRAADPLLAFLSPSGSDSLDPPRASRRTAPLLGFGPLQRIRGAESTLLLSAGPIRPTTFRPQGSSPLDGLLLHPPCLRLSTRAVLLGFSLQGFPLSNRPRSSSLPGFPSWRSSPGLAPLRLEQRGPGAHMRRTVRSPSTPFVAYRVLLRPRVRAVRAHG